VKTSQLVVTWVAFYEETAKQFARGVSVRSSRFGFVTLNSAVAPGQYSQNYRIGSFGGCAGGVRTRLSKNVRRYCSSARFVLATGLLPWNRQNSDHCRNINESPVLLPGSGLPELRESWGRTRVSDTPMSENELALSDDPGPDPAWFCVLFHLGCQSFQP